MVTTIHHQINTHAYICLLKISLQTATDEHWSEEHDYLRSAFTVAQRLYNFKNLLKATAFETQSQKYENKRRNNVIKTSIIVRETDKASVYQKHPVLAWAAATKQTDSLQNACWCCHNSWICHAVTTRCQDDTWLTVTLCRRCTLQQPTGQHTRTVLLMFHGHHMSDNVAAVSLGNHCRSLASCPCWCSAMLRHGTTGYSWLCMPVCTHAHMCMHDHLMAIIQVNLF